MALLPSLHQWCNLIPWTAHQPGQISPQLDVDQGRNLMHLNQRHTYSLLKLVHH